MSHISKIDLAINDLDALEKTCNKLGLEFRKNQKDWKWYGTYMKDWPLPEGIKPEDLGKGEHAIHIPNANYEIGLIKNQKGSYNLIYDFWFSGKVEQRLGKNLSTIRQEYTVQALMNKMHNRKEVKKMEEKQDGNKRKITLYLK